jgi:hypothetical protein
MVPTSESCGRSTRAGFGAGGASASTDTAAGDGGRRDDEKIGRSRVFDKVASGIAQSGLALRSLGSAAVGAATTGEIVRKSASRMAGLRIMSAAVMSYRDHPETAARMRRVPAPDKAEAPRTAPSLSHTVYSGQRPNSAG